MEAFGQLGAEAAPPVAVISTLRHLPSPNLLLLLNEDFDIFGRLVGKSLYLPSRCFTQIAAPRHIALF